MPLGQIQVHNLHGLHHKTETVTFQNDLLNLLIKIFTTLFKLCHLKNLYIANDNDIPMSFAIHLRNHLLCVQTLPSPSTQNSTNLIAISTYKVLILMIMPMIVYPGLVWVLHACSFFSTDFNLFLIQNQRYMIIFADGILKPQLFYYYFTLSLSTIPSFFLLKIKKLNFIYIKVVKLSNNFFQQISDMNKCLGSIKYLFFLFL